MRTIMNNNKERVTIDTFVSTMDNKLDALSTDLIKLQEIVFNRYQKMDKRIKITLSISVLSLSISIFLLFI